MTLVEFLTARLDEEATAAQAAYDRPSGYRILGTPETEDHFALWKPLRVLADVDAKRRIVSLAWHHLGDPYFAEAMESTKDEILRLLALPYADHPDYDQAWRP